MKHIAVIGAGMAGLAAAHDLSGAGLTVTLFDKSRGTGGRLATRRSEVGAFDHGAPLAQGDDSAFHQAMAGLGDAAMAVDDGWRGRPGMSGLLKPWATGLTRHAGTRIARLDDRPEGVRLTDTDGADWGPFDAVVVAIPAPQAAELLRSDALSEVRMVPVWTVMAAWDAPLTAVPDPAPAPFDAILPQDRAGAVVAHARSDWSAERLETSKPDMAPVLGKELAAALGRDAPAHAVAHLWRYGRVERALGQPFLRVSPRVLAGGDWALGPLAGDAWASGRAMAATLTAEVRP